MGMPAVAITDSHNLFGALEFAVACADAGIQPIIGCQLNITALFEEDSNKAKKKPEFITVLCQSEEGYLNLMELVSHSYMTLDPMFPPQVSLEQLLEKSAGLLCLMGGKKSPLYNLLASGHADNGMEFAKKIQGRFKSRLYIEVQRHNDPLEHTVEEGLLNIAHTLHIPIVATNDVFFKDKSMYHAHDALLCIADGRYVSETERRKVTPEHYFKSTSEMMELFKDLPEATENTVHIAKRCHFMPRGRRPILPTYDCGEGRSERDEFYVQAREGLKKRMLASGHETVPQAYRERLDYELGVIETMGFCGYFLIVSDFIQFAKSKGIPVGPGRGSGAGSLTAWSLTITDMDPIRFDLIFERFLNPERVSMPDFDIDFCQERRDEVIDYVRQKYGDDRVAHIITFGKLQARAVLRDVGRVLQMPYTQVDKISKLIPNNPANPVTLEEALVMEPALEDARKNDETVNELIEMGIKLEGLYRHASKHAAGVVIADRPLQKLVPLYTDEPGSVPATQFNMKYVELAGLVKFDFLGLKTLTVIERCCELLKDRGIHLRAIDIPLDDEKTFALLQRVETVGVFQLESSGMKEVVRKLKPDRFEDLIALVALFRPGPMDDIPRYVACKHGEEKVSYLNPALEPILKDTYGVMVYQEQVMHIAQKLGGYSLGAADLLRRAMGKKIKEEMDAQRAIFTKGATDQGIDPVTASLIFDQMAKFAGYGFNKSHSAPYALLAYQTAYLKANFPAEFYAASMTYEMHNTDKLNAFRQDMTRTGITLLPPDINYSYPDFHVEGEGVRYALAALKNVGRTVMTSLVKERSQNGLFRDIQDFARRIDPQGFNKRQLENLIASGAFDNLEKNRSLLWHNADQIIKCASSQKSERVTNQVSLFGSIEGKRQPLQLTPAPVWGPLERLSHEFGALSFFLSSHPLDIYSNLTKLGAIPSHRLIMMSDNAVVKLIGVIITKTERTSKNGNKYAFVQLSDQHGVYEIALFSENYVKARDCLIPGKALFVVANVKLEGESMRLMANQVTPLDEVVQSVTKNIRICVDERLSVAPLKTLLGQAQEGQTQITLQIHLKSSPLIDISLKERYTITPEIRSSLLAFEGVLRIEDL